MSNQPGFLCLNDLCPDLLISLDYSSPHNFTGEIVPGYKAKKAYLALTPANALKKVLVRAQSVGYGLKIFDAYRPVKAVQFFQEWAKRSENNLEIKSLYYPNYSRMELFENGFIAKQSSHSRGSAVDLTVVDLKTNEELDMGSAFDYFHESSHTNSDLISEDQRKNRMILKDLMEQEGFKNFSQEWWHYSFQPEPFPHQSFDFDVE